MEIKGYSMAYKRQMRRKYIRRRMRIIQSRDQCSKGDLETKVEEYWPYGNFGKFAKRNLTSPIADHTINYNTPQVRRRAMEMLEALEEAGVENKNNRWKRTAAKFW